MKNLRTRIGGAILTLAFIFGISVAAEMTAQAQYQGDREAQRQVVDVIMTIDGMATSLRTVIGGETGTVIATVTIAGVVMTATMAAMATMVVTATTAAMVTMVA